MSTNPAPSSPPNKESGWLSGMGGAQRYLGIGIQAGMSVVFYLLIGVLLDKLLGTFPWLMLAGIMVGVAGMFALFLRMSNELSKSSKKAEAPEES